MTGLGFTVMLVATLAPGHAWAFVVKDGVTVKRLVIGAFVAFTP